MGMRRLKDGKIQKLQHYMENDLSLSHPWYQVDSVEFGFYQPRQIRQASVLQITNPIAFDTTKTPQPQSLCDPSLGTSPSSRSSTCPTCGQSGLSCSGHLGHIQLPVPVYNPLVIGKLFSLLKIQCFNCHRLRIRQRTIQTYTDCLRLMKQGRIGEARELEELYGEVALMERRLAKEKGEKGEKEDKGGIVRRLEEVRKRIEGMMLGVEGKTEKVTTSAARVAVQEYVKKLYQQAVIKCPHCGKNYRGVKKQGSSKIFLLNQNQRQQRKASSSTTKDQPLQQPSSCSIPAPPQPTKKQTYLTPQQLHHSLKLLWRNEHSLLSQIFSSSLSSNSFNMFFLQVIAVPPNRFRPESKMGDDKYLHDHTVILTNVLRACREIRQLVITKSVDNTDETQKQKRQRVEERKELRTEDLKRMSWWKETMKLVSKEKEFLGKWLELQDAVNCFLDASKASKVADRDYKGIKQILEKKEGLFRMKMMGKRVNYAARSVISPDPSLNTDEVGLPLFMAKKLTYPQPVNESNSEMLKKLIINGKQYPGAVYLQQNGTLIKLDLLSEQQRISHASNLLINPHTKIVYRHLLTGDNVLFNRQPTLHKPGLMAHRIRVLPKEQTLRMNYANCKSYNADFDGDEMNLHALQTYTAKAEAQLCITDRIYSNPTNGKPIRELIQDSVISSVYLTLKDTFLTKSQYTTLLYQATSNLRNNSSSPSHRLFLLKPALLKPTVLWTGKQLISNIMQLIVSPSTFGRGLSMRARTKIPQTYLQGCKQESLVIVLNNELLQGIIDKNQIGSGSDYGLVHSFDELYGYKFTGQLLTALTKLFSSYLQMHGFTCGMDDLMLRRSVERSRREKLEEAHKRTVEEVAEHFNVREKLEGVEFVGRGLYACDEEGKPVSTSTEERGTVSEKGELCMTLASRVILDRSNVEEIDEEYKHHLQEFGSKIIETSLKGFVKRFPDNNFSMMTVTGAKGSNVNHSQVSVMLGQQQLQGKRVPMMISGKTLPCFIPFDPNPRAYGFISDRFLTGLRPQQFFFHCMAGRQGLIDTAVKTSRSGYLQRCLMKHLQSLKIEYDYTVRDADGSIVQFYYGEDAVDPTRQKFLEKFGFLSENQRPFRVKYQEKELAGMLKIKEIKGWKKTTEAKSDTIMNHFPIGTNLGSISQKCYSSLHNYLKSTPTHSQSFQPLFHLKYLHSLASPGQSVGCTAAQAVGQPSTQMTLNTFHLAGHGGVNLTLGIPRLRQLLMTSTDKLKTPAMELDFKQELTKQQAEYYARQLERVRLGGLVREVEVEERKELFWGREQVKLRAPDQRRRLYKIRIVFERLQLIQREFGITYDQIQEKMRKDFVVMLLDHIDRVNKKNEMAPEIKRTHKQHPEQDQDNADKQHPQGQQPLDPQPDDNQTYKKVLNSPYFSSLQFSKNDCVLQLQVPLSLKKFLMTKVIQKFLNLTVLREIRGINRAVILTRKNNKPYIQTDGVNFKAVQSLPFVDQNSVTSNDIQAIYKEMGIEAARAAIVKEIVSVFRPYGVEVDYRHLYLIADYLTFPGRVKAMNRNWMADHVSPFLKMSFETSVGFLTEAATYREVDKCRTPSSQIVLGQPPTVGTGICDLLMQMPHPK